MKFRSQYKPDFKHWIILTIIGMRKAGKRFHPTALKLSRNMQGWILFLDLSDKILEYEQPHIAVWWLLRMFFPCAVHSDAQHIHAGASHVQEVSDLPHRNCAKLRTEKHLKMSVLNLKLLLLLLLSVNASWLCRSRIFRHQSKQFGC